MSDLDGGGGRVVTQADVDLVLESMIRKDTEWLRKIGWAAEIVGWFAAAASVFVAAIQWDRFSGSDGDFGGGPDWFELAAFVLPVFTSLAVGGLTLVVLGRGARLFALHQAARRGVNVTGLVLGEPLDLELEDE